MIISKKLKNKIICNSEKLEELKMLLDYKIINYQEYLQYFRLTYLRGVR